jgi:hypothetical protein
MSKSKTPSKPNGKTQEKIVPAAHRKGRPAVDDDAIQPRSKVQIIGTVILTLLVAISMIVSVITPFFM